MDSRNASGIAPDQPGTEQMTVLERSVAVFTRPAQAWGGLKERAQWWFPVLVMVLASAASAALLHHRAVVPMMVEAWDRQVQSGQMQPQQAQRIEEFMTGPVGLGITVGQQVVVVPIITFLIAACVWFGVGFVLGTGMKYRLALEVAAWSSLISLPAQLLTMALAWIRQTMRGVHVGFGILLPEVDPPTRLIVGLGVFLDAVGPLAIWYLAVGIIGAAALSGAPRKSVAWTLGGLYLALAIFLAALAALFAPAA